MKILAALIVSLFLTSAVGQEQSLSLVIGEISFFGYAGLPVDQIRTSLPFHEGDSVTIQDVERIKKQTNQAVQSVIGRSATDIPITCCDSQGKLMIFIGLPGKSSRNFQYNPSPKGSVRLPQSLIDLYTRAMKLTLEAVNKQPGEDRSNGYALSAYKPLSEVEMSILALARRNEAIILRVLATSNQAEHRRAAAYALGYTRQSPRQISALVRASRDPDDNVRNDAVRALGVLASSSRKLAAWIPAGTFVAMVNSGLWGDRNKAAALLNILTGPRDARLLRAVRAEARESLVEMARWKDTA